MHTDGLFEIALLAAGALILGLVLQRLRQPAIVGYIVAGVVLGPSGFDLFPNRAPIETLAELGVGGRRALEGMSAGETDDDDTRRDSADDSNGKNEA